MDVLEASRPHAPAPRSSAVNDFSLVVATANGTGSQTANLTLLRAFFKMGIPVNGKNIFPSNIQGLPTWYHIRVNHEGFVARKAISEVLIAFNQATINEDIKNLPPGGVCIYNSDLKGFVQREDIIYYGLPVDAIVAQTEMKGRLKEYIANMVYVGAASYLLEIPLEVIEEGLAFNFGKRQKLVDSNMQVVKLAYDWAAENLRKTDPYRVERMNKTEGLIMMTGNEAAGLGSVFGGVSFVAWYPITPSTSLIDATKDYLVGLRHEADGRATYTVVQSEDELAAMGMILGAGWAGARAMTATSGPGISLMAEFAGLGYFAEIPAVIWDVQRVGPSTGLPTRTGQCDVTFTYYLGHGDTKNVLLLPASIEECFEFGTTSFNLAEELQTPVFVMSDLDLGMNNWMGKPFSYPSEPIKRGKVLDAEGLGDKGFSRYLDVDGDGVPYRTLPGTEHPAAAYFTRGTGHNEHAVYSEKSEDWVKNMDRLARKFDTARKLVPKPAMDEVAGSEIGIIAYGTTVYAIDEARTRLAQTGVKTSFMRLKALPIGQEAEDFINKYKRLYVIELNRDGQVHAILQTEVPARAADLRSFAYMDGMPMTAQHVIDAILKEETSA